MRNHRFKPPHIILLTLGLLLLLACVLLALEKMHVTDFIKSTSSSLQKNGPTKEQQEQQAKTDAQTKQAYLDSVTKSSIANNNDPGGTEQTTYIGTLGLTASQNGTTVTILTQLQGVTAGSCKLTVTRGSVTTSQTAQVIYQPEFSSCAGFSVPVSTLGSGGWTIALSVEPDSGKALAKSITLEVN